MRLSPHAARASQKALGRTRSRWCMTFTIHICCRLAYRGKLHRRVLHRRHLLCFLGRLDRCSRDETPDGSQPTFAEDYGVPLCFITKQPSLAPSSFTRSAIGLPCGSLSRVGALRAYHVPSVYPRGLGLISTPGVRHLRPVRPEQRFLTPYLFGPSVTASCACSHSRRSR